MGETVSAIIFVTFTILLVVGAVTTGYRWYRYRRSGRKHPVLLGRDRDLLIGLALPFVLIGAVRAFELHDYITNPDTNAPFVWWVLITGVPPIYAVARYVYYELFVIEKVRR